MATLSRRHYSGWFAQRELITVGVLDDVRFADAGRRVGNADDGASAENGNYHSESLPVDPRCQSSDCSLGYCLTGAIRLSLALIVARANPVRNDPVTENI